MSENKKDKTACQSKASDWNVLQVIAPLVQQINCLDLQQIGEICVEQVPKLVNARFASLYILDEISEMLHLQNNNHPFLINNIVSLNQANLSPMIKAIRTNNLVIIENIDHHKTQVFSKTNRKFPKNYQSDNCIIAPLICHNRVVGVLNISDKIDADKFSDEDIAIIELLRQLMGASIGNIKLFEKTQYQAKTDGLTGLANHRTFYENLERELRRCQRYGGQLSIIMADIDNLKPINDNYGHRAGDMAIKRVSRKLASCIRKIDTAARYGGDEFAIILPNTSLKEATVVAERMVEEVSRSPIIWERQKIEVSVSIGVGQYDGEMCPEEITHYSDEALYAAKQAGKNTVKVCNPTKVDIK
ncbi:MAG: sensor domain-containing diguanylate cyclase [Sedimentisphaerales bacterium]|nr:sensor domain-containing diguanylate cyclase [Sedimentisphaerales bacterium]